MPLQEGVILTRTKVRVPSQFTLFLGHFVAGAVGAAGAAIVAEALQRSTRLAPGVRAGVVAGGSLLAGGLIGRKSPRMGNGVALGGLAAAIGPASEAVETWSAMREAPVGQTTTQPSSPPREQPSSASGAIASGQGVVMQTVHSRVLLRP